MKTDVAVIGSGAAGLAAALSAASNGASVMVFERAAVFGGTSAVSGGSMWVPNNKFMAAAGVSDSREEALRYLKHLSMDTVPTTMLENFVDEVPNLVEFLEAKTGIEFEPNLHHPDYRPEIDGAKTGGRTIQGGLYDSNRLGEFQTKLRKGWTAMPITRLESDSWSREDLASWDWELIAERTKAGIVGLGVALIGELMEGCIKQGVELVSGARATELITEDDHVVGVYIEQNGDRTRVDAQRGVILASGGFEWDEGLVSQFLGVPMDAPGSPPHNVGEGLRMAMAVGASLSGMTEAWWTVMLGIPDDTYEDRPLYRPTTGTRALPGSICVNRRGRRFANETMNYNDLGIAMKVFDPVAYEYPNTPCYLIFDAQFRASYAIATVTPDAPTPSWIAQAPTLSELADRIGIDAEGLEAQVARFNENAIGGTDPDFGRGNTEYDRYRGDNRIGLPNPNLRPLDQPPFYATELRLGVLGTKGGPAIDERGRVIHVDGHLIPGLYACGNVAGSMFGPGYPGAGTPLASGMTIGMLAGADAASR